MILPGDLIWNLSRVEQYDEGEGEGEETRRLEIDSAEEKRLAALFQSARYLKECSGIMTGTFTHSSMFCLGSLGKEIELGPPWELEEEYEARGTLLLQLR